MIDSDAYFCSPWPTSSALHQSTQKKNRSTQWFQTETARCANSWPLGATEQRCPVTSTLELAWTPFEDSLLVLQKKMISNFFKKNPSVKNRHLTYGLNGGDKCSWTPMQEVNGPMSGEEWCQHRIQIWGGVALASRIDKIIGLFCKRALLKRRYSAKETYNFIDPTNCSHPISTTIHRFIDQSICHGIEGRSRST